MKKIYCSVWSESLNANRFLSLRVCQRPTLELHACTCGSRRGEECVLVCEEHRGTLCERVHECAMVERKRLQKLSCVCASRGKHIGQLRRRLCAALLCVGLIESERHPLTALCLRTLQVITHKSLFLCIGSSAQLCPHKQSTSASFITSGCLLTFSGAQSNRQYSAARR